MGSAAAYHLARAGQTMLLLEQFDMGHIRGSSHGESRIIRLSYDHPSLVKLAQAAYRLWAELGTDSGQVVAFHRRPRLERAFNPVFEACVSNLSAVHIRREVLTTNVIQRRFPAFGVADKTIGLYQAEAGVLPGPMRACDARSRDPLRCTSDRPRPVRSIPLHDDGAEVHTVQARIAAAN